MSRRTDLQATLAKNKPAVDRLLAVKSRNLKQSEALVTDLLTQNKIYAELSTLPPDKPSVNLTPPDFPATDLRWSRPLFEPFFEQFIAAVSSNTFDPSFVLAQANPTQYRALVGSGHFGNPLENVNNITDFSGLTDFVDDGQGNAYAWIHGKKFGPVIVSLLPDGPAGRVEEWAKTLGIIL